MKRNSGRKIGGDRKWVLIVKAKFGRYKYNRGHYLKCQWVNGGVERGSNWPFYVEKRDEENLLAAYVEPNTIIVSDCWRAYETLGREEFYHFMADLKAKLKDAGDNLVVIDFFATWCGPCKMIAPAIEAMAAELPDVMFLKVDVDECESIAGEYEVTSMPTFVFIKSGKKIDSFAGANQEKLKETVKKYK